MKNPEELSEGEVAMVTLELVRAHVIHSLDEGLDVDTDELCDLLGINPLDAKLD